MKDEIRAWLKVRLILGNILIYKQLRKNPNLEFLGLSPKIVGDGKITSQLHATFWSRQKLMGSWADICFLRGECTKLGEGGT